MQVNEALRLLLKRLPRALLASVSSMTMSALAHLARSPVESVQTAAATTFLDFSDKSEDNLALLMTVTAEHSIRVVVRYARRLGTQASPARRRRG
jgi:hypothetical protein